MDHNHPKLDWLSWSIWITVLHPILLILGAFSLGHAMVLSSSSQHNEGSMNSAVLTEGLLLVQYDGRDFILDMNCSGGVVFQTPVQVDRVCTRGSVFLRKSACSAENETLIWGGASTEVTCQNVSDWIQSLHYVGISKILDSAPVGFTEATIKDDELVDLDQQDGVLGIIREPIPDVEQANGLLEKRQASEAGNNMTYVRNEGENKIAEVKAPNDDENEQRPHSSNSTEVKVADATTLDDNPEPPREIVNPPLPAVEQHHNPLNETWYLVLEQIALIADSIIPSDFIPTRFSGMSIDKNDGEHGSINEQNGQFKSQFFYGVLNAFVNHTKILKDEDVNVGMNDEGQKGFWVDEVVAGLAKCKLKGRGVQKRMVLAHSKVPNCEVDLEAFHISKPEWNETSKDYKGIPTTIKYASYIDPNSYLPPKMARINPRAWLFGEILWYSVQLSYAFCFQEISETNPNAFMMAYAKMLKLFETAIVQELWSGGKSMPGRSLKNVEKYLPSILHSSKKDCPPSPSKWDEFRRTLLNFDKISYAIHRESLLDHWMQKPQRRKTSSSGSANKLGRRWKRFAIKENDSEDASTSTPSNVDEEKPVVVPLTMNEVIAMRNQAADKLKLGDVGKRGLTLEASEVTTTSVPITSSQPEPEDTLPQEVLSLEGIHQEETFQSTPSEIAVESVASTTLATTTTTTTVPVSSTTTTTDVITTTMSMSTATIIEPTTGNNVSPALILTSGEIEINYDNDEDDNDTSSTTATSSTLPPTTLPTSNPLTEFEIWDGLAYCLTMKEGAKPPWDGDWDDVRPTIGELMDYGIC